MGARARRHEFAFAWRAVGAASAVTWCVHGSGLACRGRREGGERVHHPERGRPQHRPHDGGLHGTSRSQSPDRRARRRSDDRHAHLPRGASVGVRPGSRRGGREGWTDALRGAGRPHARTSPVRSAGGRAAFSCPIHHGDRCAPRRAPWAHCRSGRMPVLVGRPHEPELVPGERLLRDHGVRRARVARRRSRAPGSAAGGTRRRWCFRDDGLGGGVRCVPRSEAAHRGARQRGLRHATSHDGRRL